ncbi:MAG: ribonuclease PH, partial [Synergistes sp.]|nr:ribonuclease PH [Synergistes sp.]
MPELLRIDGRGAGSLRPVTIERGVNRYAEGSALIKWGNTHVLCTASVGDKVPPFLHGSGRGWITAEYAMLPRATHQRSPRDVTKGKPNARGSEIQRLIGRSLRTAVDMDALGERVITIDCDVLQADGGTRTASITGGFVALYDALRNMRETGKIDSIPLKNQIAAV